MLAGASASNARCTKTEVGIVGVNGPLNAVHVYACLWCYCRTCWHTFRVCLISFFLEYCDRCANVWFFVFMIFLAGFSNSHINNMYPTMLDNAYMMDYFGYRSMLPMQADNNNNHTSNAAVNDSATSHKGEFESKVDQIENAKHICHQTWLSSRASHSMLSKLKNQQQQHHSIHTSTPFTWQKKTTCCALLCSIECNICLMLRRINICSDGHLRCCQFFPSVVHHIDTTNSFIHHSIIHTSS